MDRDKSELMSREQKKIEGKRKSIKRKKKKRRRRKKVKKDKNLEKNIK